MAPKTWRTTFSIMLPMRLGRRIGNASPQIGDYLKPSCSSLFVAADVADDVGDVLITLFLVGDKGRIVVVIVIEGLIDLDVVLRLRHDRLHLAGVLLGIGFFQRDHLFGLGGLRRFRGR